MNRKRQMASLLPIAQSVEALDDNAVAPATALTAGSAGAARIKTLIMDQKGKRGGVRGRR